VLSRQNLPVLDRSVMADAEGVARGAYILIDSSSAVPDVLLLATGSEVQLAVAAHELLAAEGVAARVVSMPCLEWFEAQDDAYRENVLPSGVRARVSVEAGIAQGWWKYVGSQGRCVSLEHFGESADPAYLFGKVGITVDAVVAAARDSIAASRSQ